MDLHYKQEVTVGLLVVVALVVLVGGLTFLSGKSFFGNRTFAFDVRFQNVSGLVQGDPVHVSGVRVGRVATIDLRSEGDVVVTLEVARDRRPKVDAHVSVRPLDAFGAMFVEYRPGRGESFLAEGQVLDGRRELPLTETAAVMAGQADSVLRGAGQVLSERTADDIHETLLAAQRALNVVAQMGSGPLATEATNAFVRLSALAARLDSTLGSPDLVKSVRQMDEITDNLNDLVVGLGDASRSLATIVQKIDSDSGSFGRMVNDTTMYHQTVELLASMRRLLDDMRLNPHRYFKISVF